MWSACRCTGCMRSGKKYLDKNILLLYNVIQSQGKEAGGCQMREWLSW